MQIEELGRPSSWRSATVTGLAQAAAEVEAARQGSEGAVRQQDITVRI